MVLFTATYDGSFAVEQRLRRVKESGTGAAPFIPSHELVPTGVLRLTFAALQHTPSSSPAPNATHLL